MSKIPTFSHKHRICIICEGDEDIGYMSRLKEIAEWNKKYEFILRNAHGESNIASLYQNLFQNDSYEVIIIFCDTDKNPHKQYKLLKEKLCNFHGIKDAKMLTDNIIIFANPCTMQIILSHFGEVSLKKQGKKTNAAIIEKYTGVQNYDAHEDQIKDICSKIFRNSYKPMKERVMKMNGPDTESGNTNFIEYLNKFESDDNKWISKTKTALNKEKK